MARGEVATIDPADLPRGSVLTTSGRISGVTEPGELSVHFPFSIKELVAVDDALKYASRASKARFAVYLGDLGADTAARAREILAEVPTPNNAVLLAVSPDQKRHRGRVRRCGARSRRRVGGAAGRRRRFVGIRAGRPDRRAGQRDPRAQLRDLAGVALAAAAAF